MYPMQLLLPVFLILRVGEVIEAEQLEQDVVKTAQLAFRGSLEPVIVCHSYENRCNAILRAVHEAHIVVSNWNFKGFRSNLILLKRETLLKYDAILFVVQSLNYLAKMFQKMPLVHSQARYVIVEVEDEKNVSVLDCCRRESLTLFQELWREKRMHRLVVLGLSCPGFALTADIFDEKQGRCVQRISTDNSEELDTIFTRRIRNMNGQILRISMSPAQDLRVINCTDGIPYEGIDATILREFVRYLNFTVQIKRAKDDKPYAFTFPNGTMIGTAIDLTIGSSDIDFNGNFMYYLGSTPAEISTWYKEDALCVVIRKAGQVPKLVALFTPFSQDFLWIVFAMVFLVGCVLYRIRLIVRLIDRDHVHMFDSVATVASCMLEAPITHKHRSNAERVLLASCSLWAIVVFGTYQGCLRGTLTIPKDLKDIDTLEELDRAGYRIYVNSENLKAVFQFPGNQLGERLVQKTILVDDIRTILKRNVPLAATLTRKESSHRRLRPNEHLISECVRQSQLSFFMRIGCPASWALNAMLKRFGEAGIIQFLRVTERREKEIQNQRLIAKTTSHPGQFTFADVQGAFVILAIGFVINTIVFALELLDG